MPLFVIKNDILYHIGTVFLICRFGVFLTAAHCISQALHEHGFDMPESHSDKEYDLLRSQIKMAVLHWHRDGDRIKVRTWNVLSMTVFHPTDIAFGSLDIHDQPNVVTTPTLSFAIPDGESSVYALGYPKNDLPPIDLQQARDGLFDWRNYQPPLMAAAGTVNATILQGYNYTKGPCIVTTCQTENGMSGGAVINSQGSVCGIVSGSAILSGGDGALASLLYPVLCMPIRSVWEPAQGFRMNFNIPLLEAIPKGWVKSDGTHELHRIVDNNGQLQVEPLVSVENGRYIFDNRASYHADQPSLPINKPDGH